MKKTFLRLGDDGSPISDGRRKRTAGNGAKARRLSPKERQLTTREREILRFLAFGMGTAAIAKELSISPATVRNHAQRILAKLQVHSRLAAVARGYAIGLLPSPQWRPVAPLPIEPPFR
ncbi:MAG TPA: LuxR C-terminal-related transcriptional regulator [Thermoanaerobaculia bacterium]|nr:LuxR C-terminal-related transcriptional regulator [Thermoanaerobaculia bacterium]